LGSGSGSIGVGFAIPSNTAKRIATEIMQTGKASHALLGALVSDATNSDASASFTVGALVEEVTAGGAAQLGGIKAKDIIVKFNDRAITSAGELTAAVRQQPAGARATVELIRDGKTMTINVTLGDAAKLN
jgi:putative serine protease PepD